MAASDDPPARVETLAPAVAAWLVGDGADAVRQATTWLDDGMDDLAVGTRLRATGLAAAQAVATADAARARRRLREQGHPFADDLLVTSAALEQASPRAAARWRRGALDRVTGGSGPSTSLTDLCAGAGLDAVVLAQDGRRVVAVEQDPARATLARHNLAATGAEARVVVGDALAEPLVGPVHADPGRRRADGRRTSALADVAPPVGALVARWRATGSPALVVSCSPALALDDPDLPADAELAFLEVEGRLVDAVLVLGRAAAPGARRAVLLDTDGRVQARASSGAAGSGVVEVDALAPGASGGGPSGPDPLDHDVDVTGRWLVEARPALVRARLHEAVGAAHGMRRASSRRALLVSDEPPPPSPWWSSRQVVADLPPRPRALRRWLATTEPRPVEWVLHGVREDVGRLHGAAGRPPRGPDGWRAELVAVAGGRRLLVTDARSVVRASS